jgi:hypothetical protein
VINNKVGIAAVVLILAGARDFFSPRSRPALVPTPASYTRVRQGRAASGVNLLGHESDNSHLELRSIMVELYLHSPIRLHGMVLKRTNLPFNTEVDASFKDDENAPFQENVDGGLN